MKYTCGCEVKSVNERKGVYCPRHGRPVDESTREPEPWKPSVQSLINPTKKDREMAEKHFKSMTLEERVEGKKIAEDLEKDLIDFSIHMMMAEGKKKRGETPNLQDAFYVGDKTNKMSKKYGLSPMEIIVLVRDNMARVKKELTGK